MSAPTYDIGSMGLMLNELRLPTIGRLWSDFAQRSDKEGWQASQLLGALFEHELAERAKRRIERHRVESQLDPAKTLATFEFDDRNRRATAGRIEPSDAVSQGVSCSHSCPTFREACLPVLRKPPQRVKRPQDFYGVSSYSV